MDHLGPGDRDFEADLESGGAYNEEASNKEAGLGAKNQATVLLAKVCGENVVSVCSTTSNAENVKTDMKAEGLENLNSPEKKAGKEKRKKTSNKKPPKPPRGPSLDAADKKLIREISELAMLKRAKLDRMKALKKMKAAKSTSSSSNLLAMVFTILFCFVILFQGLSSRTSRSADSEPGGMEGGLISVQYYGNPSPNDLHGPASGSPGSVEQVTGPDPQVRPQRFNR